MTAQEFYDWCKQKGLTDARIEICIDGAIFIDVTEKDIMEFCDELVVFEVET